MVQGSGSFFSPRGVIPHALLLLVTVLLLHVAPPLAIVSWLLQVLALNRDTASGAGPDPATPDARELQDPTSVDVWRVR